MFPEGPGLRYCEPLRWSEYTNPVYAQLRRLDLRLTPENGHGLDDERSRPYTTVARMFEEDDTLNDPEGWAHSPQNVNDILFQMVKISEHLKQRRHSTRAWDNIRIRLVDSTLSNAPLTKLIRAKVQLFQLNTIAELAQTEPSDKISLAGMTAFMKRRRQLSVVREHAEDILRFEVAENPMIKVMNRKLAVQAAERKLQHRKENRSRAERSGLKYLYNLFASEQPEDDPYAMYLDNTFREVERSGVQAGLAAEELQKRCRELYEQLVHHILDTNEYGAEVDIGKAFKAFGRSQARIESGRPRG